MWTNAQRIFGTSAIFLILSILAMVVLPVPRDDQKSRWWVVGGMFFGGGTFFILSLLWMIWS